MQIIIILQYPEYHSLRWQIEIQDRLNSRQTRASAVFARRRMLYCHLLYHNDTIIKIHAGRLLLQNMYLSLYCKGSKRLFKVCLWEGVGDRTETAIFWPPTLMAVNVVSFSFSRAAQPEAQRPTLLGDLLHLISNFSAPQLNRGPRALLAWCGFPYHISSITPSDLSLQLSWFLSWLSYIMVQRPLSHLLDLWNRMFDRHQAEITVMQFTGHSLRVLQSMSVPWEFFFTSSHFVSQFPPTRFPLITAIRMCHLLPVHHLGMAFLAGSKAKTQQEELRALVTTRIKTTRTWWLHYDCDEYFSLPCN